jgi:hypothetical protein
MPLHLKMLWQITQRRFVWKTATETTSNNTIRWQHTLPGLLGVDLELTSRPGKRSIHCATSVNKEGMRKSWVVFRVSLLKKKCCYGSGTFRNDRVSLLVGNNNCLITVCPTVFQSQRSHLQSLPTHPLLCQYVSFQEAEVITPLNE